MRPIPYSERLGARDPLEAIDDTLRAVTALTAAWAPEDFERTYAPGKWTARQVLTHLAQTELALGARVRMALAMPNYTAQAFDQDAWMARDSRLSGRDAVAAFVAIGRMNLTLFGSLSAADRSATFSHPEYGLLDIDWVTRQMAGHQIHHLQQLESCRRL